MNLFKSFKLLLFIFNLLLVSEIASGKRGGGIGRGGGVKISNTRIKNTYISKTKVNVGYGSRYRPWGSGYGGYNSWYSYGSTGRIYGFVYYTRTRYYMDHPDKEPTICRNEFDNLMDNGTHYEWFICPSENLSSDFHYCCGEDDKQHCCKFWDDGWRAFGVVTSFIFFIGFITFLCYCCCCRRRTQTEQPYFQRVFTRKITTRTEIDVPLAPGGFNQPQYVPEQPPPSFPMYPSQPSPVPQAMPMPMAQPGGYMPSPQTGMPMSMPQPGQPMGPQSMSGMCAAPPYPIDGSFDSQMPPSYSSFQPSAPPYPGSADVNLPYPPHPNPNQSYMQPLAPSQPTAPPAPIGMGYPISPPPPYGQQ